jgi:hypothetical protein
MRILGLINYTGPTKLCITIRRFYPASQMIGYQAPYHPDEQT